MSQQTLEKLVYPVVAEIGQTLPDGAEFPQLPSTVLVGNGAVLDSVNLVYFILALEDYVESATGKRIRMVTEHAMSRNRSPFRTLSSVAEYVDELMAPK